MIELSRCLMNRNHHLDRETVIIDFFLKAAVFVSTNVGNLLGLCNLEDVENRAQDATRVLIHDKNLVSKSHRAADDVFASNKV